MGGSSAPPGDLERKFGKSKRQVLNLERRQRFLEMRQDLIKLKECCMRWEQSPLFNREQTMTVINRLERLAHAKTEPDMHRRMELEDTILNRLVPLAGELRRHGSTPRALALYQRLYEGYRLAFSEERRRQGAMGIDLLEEGVDMGSLTTKAAMLKAIDDLVLKGAFERMNRMSYYRFRVYAHELGVYLPVHPAAPRRFFSKSIATMPLEELERKLREHRLRATFPHDRFSKFMYLLFGFKVPDYTADELQILQSPVLKARFREAARRYHPDRTVEPLVVAKFWYKIYTDTWRVLQARRRFLEEYPVAVVDNGVVERRSLTELFWPDPPVSRGLMLPK